MKKPNKFNDLKAEIEKLRDVVRMQTEALKSIEQVGMGGYMACPRCMGNGYHSDDCEIPKAIKAAGEVLKG